MKKWHGMQVQVYLVQKEDSEVTGARFVRERELKIKDFGDFYSLEFAPNVAEQVE